MPATRGTDHDDKEIFEVIRRSEEAVIEAGRNWAKAVGGAIPVEMPVVRELVKGSFDFAEEVLKAQREFVHSILTATKPTHEAGHAAHGHRATTTRQTTKVA